MQPVSSRRRERKLSGRRDEPVACSRQLTVCGCVMPCVTRGRVYRSLHPPLSQMPPSLKCPRPYRHQVLARTVPSLAPPVVSPPA